MDIERLLKTIGINYPVEVTKTETIVRIPDSNHFSRVYTLLDSSNLVTLDQDETELSVSSSKLNYYAEIPAVKLTLEGDFDNNVYILSIEEL